MSESTVGESVANSTEEPCQHEYGGSYWVKYGLGWAIEQQCHKCGHREYSNFVGFEL